MEDLFKKIIDKTMETKQKLVDNINTYQRNISQKKEDSNDIVNEAIKKEVTLTTNSKLNDLQMWQIQTGAEHGLSMELKLYANPNFNKSQIEQILYGFVSRNLTFEQVKFYADLKYNAEQMREIREGFEDGLSMDQIQTYADPILNSSQMQQAREGLVKNGKNTIKV